MATIINVETGVQEYDINGAFTARFNPTDETFIHKLELAFESLNGVQDKLKDASRFDVFNALDDEMRTVIDGLLGDGAAAAIFPNVNCYALSGGLPIWLNLMYGITDVVADACEAEFGKTDERLKRLNNKYGAMMAKYRKK